MTSSTVVVDLPSVNNADDQRNGHDRSFFRNALVSLWGILPRKARIHMDDQGGADEVMKSGRQSMREWHVTPNAFACSFGLEVDAVAVTTFIRSVLESSVQDVR